MRDKVSVIIPTYNSAKTIEQCINSVINQTYKNKEIIVIDDGSTDNTSEIISKNFSNIIYHKIEHSGFPGKVRNDGIKLSSGKYISFLDSDDYWDKDVLKVLMTKAQKETETILFYGSLVYDGSDRDSRKIQDFKKPYSGYVFDKMVSENFIPMHPAVIKKEAVESVGNFDETLRLSMDYDLWLRITYYYPTKYCPDAVGYYRIQEDSHYFGADVLERNITTCRIIYSAKKEFQLKNVSVLKRLAVLNLTISKNYLQKRAFLSALFFLYPFLRYTVLFYMEKIKKCVF